MMRKKSYQRGFSLIELSIVLVIVGVLIGGIITGVATFRRNMEIQEVRDKLVLIHDALLGYAVANGRLPCPDRVNSGDGWQDWNNTNCDTDFGFLPYRDLGLSGFATDPWGNPYAYRVDAEFADATDGTTNSAACPDLTFPDTLGVSFEICAQGELVVYDTGGVGFNNCTVPGCNRIAENVPAIFYSYGPNGFNTQSVHELENLMDTPANDPLNLINDPNERVFVWRPYAESGANYFDDQVMWISPYVLANRMIQARRLP